MIANKLTKLLTLSTMCIALINSKVLAGPETSTTCVNVAQFIFGINMQARKAAFKGSITPALIEYLKKIGVINDKGQVVAFKKFDGKIGQVTKTDGPATNYDPIQLVLKNDQDAQNNIVWKDRASAASNAVTSTVSDIQTNNAGKQYITITTTHKFTGANDNIMPINGDTQHGTYIDANQNNTVVVQDDDGFGNPNNKEKTSTFTQTIFLDAEKIGVPKYVFDNDNFYNLTQQLNEKNFLDGSIKNWEGAMAGYAGGRFNLPLGAAIEIYGFLSKALINSTHKFEFGKSAESTSKSETTDKNNNTSETSNGWQFDMQRLWEVGFGINGVIPLTEKVELIIGGGLQRNTYKSTISSNSGDNNTTSSENKTSFLKTTQEMTSWAPFLKLGFRIFFTKNIGGEIFYKHTMSSSLKEKDKSSSDESTSDKDNKRGFSQSYKDFGGSSIGIGLICKF